MATLSRKRVSKAKSFPKGVGYNIPIPRDLLGSPAWLAMSHQCRKLVDALMRRNVSVADIALARQALQGAFEGSNQQRKMDNDLQYDLTK